MSIEELQESHDEPGRPPDSTRATKHGGPYDTAQLIYRGVEDGHYVYSPISQCWSGGGPMYLSPSIMRLRFPLSDSKTPK